MSIFAIILLILLGLVLLLIEFAVIPGVTIAGIGGFLLLGASVYIAFSEYGTGVGLITLTVVLVVTPIMIYYFFKSRTGRKMILEKNIEGKVDLINNEKVNVGDTGKSVGRLAPMGRVKVNGEVVEGQSVSGMIDPNTEIKVLKVYSNKIIVEPIKK
jgi:membrane-bound ClpP family serine protease